MSITATASGVPEQLYRHVVEINNGGDEPPLVDIEYLKADDPEQIASGDAVVYVSGTQEKLLPCDSVRIEVWAERSAADAPNPFREVHETEHAIGRRSREYHRPLAGQNGGAGAELHCTMWVRKLGTDVHGVHDLQTTVDLLRGHDQNGVILTLALRNFGDADFHGSFKMINVLPNDLQFGSTVAVEQWTGMHAAESGGRPMAAVGITTDLSSNLARQDLLHHVIAFQEHLHGQALIYQAKAVSIPPGRAVAVNYIANVSSW